MRKEGFLVFVEEGCEAVKILAELVDALLIHVCMGQELGHFHYP